jgi:hypothetical protein
LAAALKPVARLFEQRHRLFAHVRANPLAHDMHGSDNRVIAALAAVVYGECVSQT